MRVGKWIVNDKEAFNQYINNLRELEDSDTRDSPLYITNSMLFDHIVDSIEEELSESDLQELEDLLLVESKRR